MKEIINQLQMIFRKIFDNQDLIITSDTTADDIDDWDSLTHMQLIVEIEKKFGIKFTTAEIKKAANVGEFIDIIKDKI
ncbi:acyl carrier protein [Succinimonas sp.]|uniref:acyl carrier protein n=1 Tax=Succinimonas sp. TaxID=1936151 RepID=UPI003864F1C9